MKIAILGYGNIAKRHIDNIARLRPDADMIVLRRRDEPLAAEHKDIARTASLDDVLSFAPHCAIVASPASEHIDQATALAKIGANLLIEKPLSHNLDGVDELISLCELRGVVLSVAYDMAYINELRFLTSEVASGIVGKVLSVNATVGQYLPDWRPHIDYRTAVSASAALGGGALLELSHELEYVDRLIGGTRSVYCVSGVSGILDIDVEDHADLILEGASGAIASVHLNMLQKVPHRECRVVGSDGVMTIDFLRGVVSRNVADSGGWSACDEIDGRGNDPYLDELENFFACVDSVASPLVDGRRGEKILRVVLAAKKSSAKGAKIEL